MLGFGITFRGLKLSSADVSYPGFCNIMAVMKYTDHMNMLLQLQLKGSAPKEGFRVLLNASGDMQGEFSGSSHLMLDECSLSLVGTSTIASPCWIDLVRRVSLLQFLVQKNIRMFGTIPKEPTLFRTTEAGMSATSCNVALGWLS